MENAIDFAISELDSRKYVTEIELFSNPFPRFLSSLLNKKLTLNQSQRLKLLFLYEKLVNYINNNRDKLISNYWENEESLIALGVDIKQTYLHITESLLPPLSLVLFNKEKTPNLTSILFSSKVAFEDFKRFLLEENKFDIGYMVAVHEIRSLDIADLTRKNPPNKIQNSILAISMCLYQGLFQSNLSTVQKSFNMMRISFMRQELIDMIDVSNSLGDNDLLNLDCLAPNEDDMIKFANSNLMKNFQKVMGQGEFAPQRKNAFVKCLLTLVTPVGEANYYKQVNPADFFNPVLVLDRPKEMDIQERFTTRSNTLFKNAIAKMVDQGLDYVTANIITCVVHNDLMDLPRKRMVFAACLLFIFDYMIDSVKGNFEYFFNYVNINTHFSKTDPSLSTIIFNGVVLIKENNRYINTHNNPEAILRVLTDILRKDTSQKFNSVVQMIENFSSQGD